MNDCNCKKNCTRCRIAKENDGIKYEVLRWVVIWVAVFLTIFMYSCTRTPEQQQERHDERGRKKHAKLRKNYPRIFKAKADTTKNQDSLKTETKWPEQSEIDSLLDEHCKRNKPDTVIKNGDTTIIYRDRTVAKWMTKEVCNPRKIYGPYEKIVLKNAILHIWYSPDGRRDWVVENETIRITEECPDCPECKPNGLVIPWWILWTAAGLFVLAVVIAFARSFVKLFNPLR